MRPISIGPIAVTACAVLGLSGAAHAERFHYQYHPGQMTVSRVSMAGAAILGPTGASMARMQFRSVSRQTERVRSLAGGIVTIDVTDQPISTETIVGGKADRSRKPVSKSEVRVTDHGKFLTRKSSGKSDEANDGSPGLDGLDITYGLSFPDKDLQPGDKWENTLTMGSGPTAQRVRATWRYVGHVKFRGRDCIRVNTNVSLVPPAMVDDGEPAAAAAPQSRMTANVVTYFDPAKGVEVYSSGSVILSTRADLSALGADGNSDGGSFAGVTKINVVQSLLSGTAK